MDTTGVGNAGTYCFLVVVFLGEKGKKERTHAKNSPIISYADLFSVKVDEKRQRCIIKFAGNRTSIVSCNAALKRNEHPGFDGINGADMETFFNRK
ncbi:hypothetical protein TcasGA2_TC014448 [Tribolium castaneum]|uniref:Uncharacterized protein n=1 Tax=Tribolium castaneum TaxID=7070 RepID=D6WM05_TRICA|nr:hypothetical protein TcasGA2_TC014448 [Tribolium castaneum]